jgi:hypothetical protein
MINKNEIINVKKKFSLPFHIFLMKLDYFAKKIKKIKIEFLAKFLFFFFTLAKRIYSFRACSLLSLFPFQARKIDV